MKRLLSSETLLRLMSEVISLREQVAQAELRVLHLRSTAARPVATSDTKKPRRRKTLRGATDPRRDI